MTKYYLTLLLSVVLLSFQFVLNKYYQSKNGSGITTSLLFTSLAGIFSSFIFFCVNGFSIQITPFSFICALGIAALCLSYTLIGFRILSLGDYSVYMMFLMLGGMLLPFVYGMLFLGDASRLGAVSLAARVSGAVLLSVSLFLPCVGRSRGEKTAEKNGGNKKNLSLFIALCALVFVMNGFVSIISKLHQISDSIPKADANSFVALSNGANALISASILLFICLKKREKPSLAKSFGAGKLILTTLVCGLLGGGSYLLQLITAASPLPASVQYPMITGGSVILSAVAGRVFFGEKPDKWSLAGIILAFAATFLFLF